MRRWQASRCRRIFGVEWQNEFIKAQRGTFVPFTLSVDASRLSRPSALVYVRAAKRGRRGTAQRGQERESRRAERVPGGRDFSGRVRPAVRRAGRYQPGFSVPPGEYDVFVVMRERVDPEAARPQPESHRLRQQLSVPEFSVRRADDEHVIVADRLTTLAEAGAGGAARGAALRHRPHRDHAGRGSQFKRDEELDGRLSRLSTRWSRPSGSSTSKWSTIFSGRADRSGGGLSLSNCELSHPPVRPGERYFNHTDPQRFNPALMGAAFDPGSGEPVMAGQVVPLAGFEHGEYRLDVRVTDLLSGKSSDADVVFTVGSLKRELRDDADYAESTGSAGTWRVGMQRLDRVLTASVIAGTVAPWDRSALSIGAGPARSIASPSAPLRGSITGVVSDDRGGPIAGAMVSALGTATMAKATTDASRLVLDRCAAGRRLHAAGPSHRLRRDPRARRFASAVCPPRLSGCNCGGSKRRRDVRHDARSRRGRSWPPASGCPPARWPISPMKPTSDTAVRDDHPHSETRVAAPAHQAQHPEGSSPIVTVVERDPEIHDDSFRLASSAARWFRGELCDDVLHRAAVLGRSEPADDERVRDPGELFSRRAAAARRRLPRHRRADGGAATGRCARR